MLYTLRFFSSKCSLFHNANLFGSCNIHILYTGCAKVKKNNSGAKGLNSNEGNATPKHACPEAFLPLGLPYFGLVTPKVEILATGKFHKTSGNRLPMIMKKKLQPKGRKKPGEAIKEASRSVRSERLNKWPISMITR